MKDLIPIFNQVVGEKEVNAVDARELWMGLKSGQKFTDWIKAKVLDNEFFAEGEDWVPLDKTTKRASTGASVGGSNKQDYILSLDTAKRVAMAERTAVGEKVRTHFLACEKEALHMAALTPDGLIVKTGFEIGERMAEGKEAVKHFAATYFRFVKQGQEIDLTRIGIEATAESHLYQALSGSDVLTAGMPSYVGLNPFHIWKNEMSPEDLDRYVPSLKLPWHKLPMMVSMEYQRDADEFLLSMGLHVVADEHRPRTYLPTPRGLHLCKNVYAGKTKANGNRITQLLWDRMADYTEFFVDYREAVKQIAHWQAECDVAWKARLIAQADAARLPVEKAKKGKKGLRKARKGGRYASK